MDAVPYFVRRSIVSVTANEMHGVAGFDQGRADLLHPDIPWILTIPDFADDHSKAVSAMWRAL
jgi:hypothetical protein